MEESGHMAESKQLILLEAIHPAANASQTLQLSKGEIYVYGIEVLFSCVNGAIRTSSARSKSRCF